ncbi:MAG: SUMF1/EgtB/PvdO family nonheme iron enzyme, partial [Muribaculaceae bacterium]|nr:SUMF1/EgtB/PvdO family nonheme iron enzyme [Muribaculaceae bacterium]
MYCKHCGKQIDDDAIFCQYCGTKLVENAEGRILEDTKSDGRTTKLSPKKQKVIMIYGVYVLIWIFAILCTDGDDRGQVAVLMFLFCVLIPAIIFTIYRFRQFLKKEKLASKSVTKEEPLLKFISEHGKLQLKITNNANGDVIKSHCICTASDGTMTQLHFSQQLGLLSPAEISANKAHLLVAETEDGQYELISDGSEIVKIDSPSLQNQVLESSVHPSEPADAPERLVCKKKKMGKVWLWIVASVLVFAGVAVVISVCMNNGSLYESADYLPEVEVSYRDGVLNVNGITYEMIEVEGGTFTMGATKKQGSDAESDEKLTLQVTLSDYYIGKTEVTQALWEAVMVSNPSVFIGDNLPVESVSWDDCQEFIRRLNSLTGENFRLPSEAEWEYAAHGGNRSRGYKFSGSNNIGDVAWYWDNSWSKIHPVGTKAPNELGIYDMSGNVEEWCSDWYDEDYDSSA